ncbi:hypothetical protein GXP71_16110 [Cellulomonas sp. H30R-01]|uniref:hypothetical protein n=1 Tax=Cellulomonas sp. H30R-01 TaxID=2704467 RepID=UPI00138B2B93|nr:hypothetical protein [Cellulomonas sp. H30R-01]QHT57443.1 hypothetical protein GXP71_16110 [Cellulomonas sp. H30R-01]
MTVRRSTRRLAAGLLAAALVVAAPAAAVAHGGGHGGGHGPGGGHGHDRPASYLLDPVGPASDDVYPEGVAVHGDDFSVGSTTDGTVYRGDLDDPTATPFLAGGADGRTSAVGMKTDGRTLVVAGGSTGRVLAYDVRTRVLVGSWLVAPTGAPTFVNDVAISPRGDVSSGGRCWS